MENNFYRTISFPSFVNLITLREEMFVHPTQWDDTYEGIFFAVQKNPERCEMLLRELCSKYNGDLNTTLTNFVKCLYFPLFSYAQCWSREADSDAMWRIYNYDNKSIQICTTEECWRNILENHLNPTPNCSNYTVVIKDVEYDLNGDSNTIIKALQSKALTDNDLCDMYFHKRLAFQHEKEKRVLIFNKAGANVFDYFGQYPIYNKIKELCDDKLEKVTIDTIVLALNNYLSTEKSLPSSQPSMSVDLSDIALKDYVKSVKLNPFAPDWIDNLVNELCQRNDIDYVGKSTLYNAI